MSWPHLNRRLHLYLALSLLPWFLVYGASSLFFAHPSAGGIFYNDGVPEWSLHAEHPFEEPPPDGDGAALKQMGKRIMELCGLEGSYGVHRQSPTQVNVYVYTFLKATQVEYHLDRKLLLVKNRRFRWDQFLTGIHARGGFEQEGILNRLWAVVVDVVCLGFLVWITTGIIMWRQLKHTRMWGWVALAGGIGLFGVLLIGL